MIGIELKLLLVEDSESDADLLLRFLKKEQITVKHLRVWDKGSFISAIDTEVFDIIISDQNMPQFSGIEAFNIAKAKSANTPFIMVSGSVSEKHLIEFANQGIDDYILKDNLLRLPSAIKHVLNTKKIQLLHTKLESAHKDIKDSINYAKKIQNAMLPDTKVLNQNFPESFIYFKPKDTLSGDFYWFKVVNDTFFLAVADCTGHGIPGALLSMVGIEKLNNFATKTKLPSEILLKLSKRIRHALSESTLYEQSNDGMDIAFCSITQSSAIKNSDDVQNNNLFLQYAGANRPLWIIRNKATEIEEYKPTKKSIGGIINHTATHFENHAINIKKNDSCYLFSDGFADQFGGPKNKKITTKGFKKLLLSIQYFNMQQQYEYISKFFDDWKQEYEQVDDVLLIGIKF